MKTSVTALVLCFFFLVYYCQKLFGGYMARRLNIKGITNSTHDWTCKVQIVDISRERQSPEKKLRFQNLIFEDEEDQQVRAVIYADDIDEYADEVVLFTTYLVSAARVKASSTSYGRPIHTFYWILDKETILEEIKPTNELEKPLPPPTKLDTAAFDSIARMTPGPAVEIDILGAVLRCGPLKFAGCTTSRRREVTLCDERRNQFLLTLWDDFGEIEGAQLEAKMQGGKEFQVILGRNIGISPYQGFSLQTRFNSTIRINPTYLQALALISWCTFQIDVIDGSGSTTTSISGDLAEKLLKLLSMMADDVYDITCAKHKVLSIDGVQQILSNKMFQIQLRKSSWKGPNGVTQTSLAILSYTGKEDASASSTNKRNANEVEMEEIDLESGSSSSGLLLEPSTPVKKV